MRYLVLAIALSLGGCAAQVMNKPWTKPGASAADLKQAKSECEFEAVKADVSFEKATWMTEARQVQLIDLCLRSKGYSHD